MKSINEHTLRGARLAILDSMSGPLSNSPWWWRLSATDRRWVAGAAACLALLCSAAAACAWWQSRATAEAQLQLTQAQHEQALAAQRAAQDERARAEAKAPWWTRVPSAATAQRSAAEQLSADALALAPKLGVQVQRLTFGAPSHTEGAPYRSTSVQAEVRGSYADIKRWIAELLARRPNALALKSVDLRRGPGDATELTVAQAGSIEASIEWRLFERLPQR
jgi:hypothetical protein